MTDMERRTSARKTFTVRVVDSYTWPENDLGRVVSTNVSLWYDMVSPFEVTMDTKHGDETISWVFSRDILIDGVRGGMISGFADVQAWSTDNKFYLRLASPDGVGILQFDLPGVKMFTRWMKLICPQGQEEMSMDLVIAQIFREEAR